MEFGRPCAAAERLAEAQTWHSLVSLRDGEWDVVGVGTQTRRSQTLTNGTGAGSWSLGSRSQGTACWGFNSWCLFSSLCLSAKRRGRSEWWLEVEETGGGRVEYKRTSRRRFLAGARLALADMLHGVRRGWEEVRALLQVLMQVYQ